MVKMITVLITQDEEKIKDVLTNVLQQEGYNISDVWEEKNFIKVIKKEDLKDISILQDKVINLEKFFYKGEKGTLYKYILQIIEKPLIEHMLERTEGNQLKAARILGINRNTIRAKIKKLNIEVGKWKK